MSDSPPLEFVDTNVLVYAHDQTAGSKRDVASRLLARFWQERCGALSIQVLQELAVNLTRKMPHPLTPTRVKGIVTALAEWRVYSPEPADVVQALELGERHQVSFWDAMILCSAARLGCRVVWSEDLNSGQVYSGVEVRNPFSPAT